MSATYREDVRNLKNGAKKTYASAKSHAQSGARRVKDVVEDEAEGFASQVQGQVHNLAEETGRLAREAYDYGRERVEAGAETARATVQERPLAMVAAAFFGGAVLAALLRR